VKSVAESQAENVGPSSRKLLDEVGEGSLQHVGQGHRVLGVQLHPGVDLKKLHFGQKRFWPNSYPCIHRLWLHIYNFTQRDRNFYHK
jgi:hypothetical protein